MAAPYLIVKLFSRSQKYVLKEKRIRVQRISVTLWAEFFELLLAHTGAKEPSWQNKLSGPGRQSK